ncbi:MAG TPA: hypothetical protein VGL66_06560 [Caulobacteraceae bacterium]|jgi:hypothetical protein
MSGRVVRAFAAACAAFVLPGCAVVVARTADAPPRLSAWPFGVRVERGRGDAVSVDSASLGMVAGCGLVGLGLQRCAQIRIDAHGCGVAIVEQPDPKSRALLARIAGQARAACLHSNTDKEAIP